MSFESKNREWTAKEVSRRRFLGFATAGLGAVAASMVGVPLVGSLMSPLLAKKKASEEWADLGKVEDFKDGKPTMVQWVVSTKDGWVMETTPRMVWVVKRGDDFTVFNPRCTHLNCAVSWRLNGEKHTTAYGSPMPDYDHFFCPCHDGIYDLDGKVVGGPPPRPLDTLPVKVEDGHLFTIYKDFRVGIHDKVEL